MGKFLLNSWSPWAADRGLIPTQKAEKETKG